MKVFELIAELLKMPAGAEIYISPNNDESEDDGANHICLDEGGDVLITRELNDPWLEDKTIEAFDTLSKYLEYN